MDTHNDPKMSHSLRGREFSFPLRSAISKLLLILLVGIPAVLVSFQVAKVALAAMYSRRQDTADLQRAIALDPENASYDHQLGLVYSYSFDQANLSDATRYLRKATELDPRKALYWSDLGEVCDSVGDTACSDQAVQRALSLSPKTPKFVWKAGNHYLQTGQTDQALALFRRLLGMDDTYAQPVFRVCLRVVGNSQAILQQVMPPGRQTQLKLAYLNVVSMQGDTDDASQIWNQISPIGTSVKFSQIRSYVESLIAADDITQASAVWRQLEQTRVIPNSTNGETGNLVYNGQFNHLPLDAGFDWRDPNTQYVETDFQDPYGEHDSACLRVDYAAGKNLESEPAYEFVPVMPKHSYRLQADVRTDSITSDSGPRLRVLDPVCPACLTASTETTVGTTPWHQLALDFTTGAQTRVVRLSVWRVRSRTFPMEISGSFWLDNVSITPLSTKPNEVASRN